VHPRQSVFDRELDHSVALNNEDALGRRNDSAALLVTLLGINVVGDWLRDTLDPTVGEAG
jgi:hypothetical protein